MPKQVVIDAASEAGLDVGLSFGQKGINLKKWQPRSPISSVFISLH